MDRAKLLILLGEAWESDDMRQTLTNGLIGTSFCGIYRLKGNGVRVSKKLFLIV